MKVPAWAYKRHAVKGDIDANELMELEKFASGFTTKEALSPFARDVLLTTGVATAAPIIGYGAMKGIDALGNIGKARREKRNLDKILSVHPDIGEATDPRVAMAYSTLKRMNPEFADDPLLAGPLMKQIVESRMDPMNPSSGSYVDPGQAAKLMDLRNNTNRIKGSPSLSNMVGQSITQSLPKGFDSALSRQRQQEDMLENRRYQESLFDARRDESRDFQASQDRMRRNQQMEDLAENRRYQEGQFRDRRDEGRIYQAGQDALKRQQRNEDSLRAAFLADRMNINANPDMAMPNYSDGQGGFNTPNPAAVEAAIRRRHAMRKAVQQTKLASRTKVAGFSIRETISSMRNNR